MKTFLKFILAIAIPGFILNRVSLYVSETAFNFIFAFALYGWIYFFFMWFEETKEKLEKADFVTKHQTKKRDRIITNIFIIACCVVMIGGVAYAYFTQILVALLAFSYLFIFIAILFVFGLIVGLFSTIIRTCRNYF